MATPQALEGLQQAQTALEEIQEHLQPFVRRLQSSTATRQQRAQAQAVVALGMGTLRYMGARLRGLDQGRSPDDPLRQELNQMRKVLVSLEQKSKKTNAAKQSHSKSDDDDKKKKKSDKETATSSSIAKTTTKKEPKKRPASGDGDAPSESPPKKQRR